MRRHILLLRGINLGPNRRVAMPRTGYCLAQGEGDVSSNRVLRARRDDRVLDPVDVHQRPAPVATFGSFERHQRVNAIGTYELAVTERNQGR